MSLTISQSRRLRTYEMLRGQSEGAIRRALNLRPDQCPRKELARLQRPLERMPDPRPNVTSSDRPGGLSPDAGYPERRMYHHMSALQQVLYLMIREAAERGDRAPRYVDM